MLSTLLPILKKAVFITIASGLAYLLIKDIVSTGQFVALGCFFILVWSVYHIEPKTITEITAWKLSIKSDVSKARRIREEIQAIKDELLEITKLSVENAYILASSSFLAMGGDKEAGDRINENITKLSQIVEPLKEKEDAWWKDLRGLFPGRKHED